MKIYLINIEDVNDYIDAHDLLTATIEFAEGMTEEQCIEITQNSRDNFADVYTPQEFEAEFNNDIDSIIKSDRYFIRIF